MKSRSSVFTFLVAGILLAGTLTATAAVRTVLLESFTNWS
jgi:hypothetical protein